MLIKIVKIRWVFQSGILLKVVLNTITQTSSIWNTLITVLQYTQMLQYSTRIVT